MKNIKKTKWLPCAFDFLDKARGKHKFQVAHRDRDGRERDGFSQLKEMAVSLGGSNYPPPPEEGEENEQSLYD